MERLYCICLFTIVLLCSLNLPAQAKKVALVGVPITQTRSTTDSAFNIQLDNNQKVSNQLVIIKEDDQYYWETRDHRELIFKKLKRFHMFIDPETGGYIKIVQQEDGRFLYLEHISYNDFRTFTYWGVLSVYRP